MTEVIPAAELAVGDLYRPVSLGVTVHCAAYRVTAVRTIVTGAVYRRVEAVNVATGNIASISLRADVEVARLSPISLSDLTANIETLPDGAAVTIVRADGVFWC